MKKKVDESLKKEKEKMYEWENRKEAVAENKWVIGRKHLLQEKIIKLKMNFYTFLVLAAILLYHSCIHCRLLKSWFLNILQYRRF